MATFIVLALHLFLLDDASGERTTEIGRYIDAHLWARPLLLVASVPIVVWSTLAAYCTRIDDSRH